MKAYPTLALTTADYPRRTARQGAIHAQWLRRLGTAQVAWGIFIGSSRMQMLGHELRIQALREQRRMQPRA
jgi:hypothetical protein